MRCALNSSDIDLILRRADELEQGGSLTESIEILQTALQDPAHASHDRARLYKRLSAGLVAVGRESEVSNLLRQAVTLNPQDSAARLELVESLWYDLASSEAHSSVELEQEIERALQFDLGSEDRSRLDAVVTRLQRRSARG